MPSPAPRVTLVVPSFNEAPEIIRTSLASVRDQTFPDFECIVVDESTDTERAQACSDFCALDPRFTYVHPTERLGLAASLNLGISRARGELIARFDSDDICLPERVARQVAFFDANPGISVVGGGLEVMDDHEDTLAFRDYPRDHARIAAGMQLTTTLAHPTVMYRRSVVEAHGGYDPSFRFAEDLDLWLRWLNADVKFANLPDVLVRYRQHVTRRDPRHWQFNRRARVKNFAMSYPGRRALGIVAISLWTVLPAAVQETVFKTLVFRRRQGVRT